MRLKCSNCKEKTLHRYMKSEHFVRIVNRSGKRKIGLFKKHYSCVLRKDKYYLYTCSIYRCLICGEEKKVFHVSKKISQAQAEKSGLRMLNNYNLFEKVIR